MPKEPNKATVGDIIPFRKAGSADGVQAPPKPKVSVDDLIENLNQQLEIGKIAKLGQTLGVFESGQANRVPAAAGESSLEQLAKVGSMLGIDFTKITELRQHETEALRTELDKERRFALEQRLNTIDNVVVRMNDTMQAFIKSQQEVRAAPVNSGLFGMADQMTDNSLTKALLARVLKDDQPQSNQKDPFDEILDRLSTGERLKKALGLSEPQRPAIDPSVVSLGKTELVRLLLDDDRERERMKQNNEMQKMKMDKLGGFFQMVQEYMPDILAAVATRGGDAADKNVSRDQSPLPKQIRKPQAKPPAAAQTAAAAADTDLSVSAGAGARAVAESGEVPPQEEWIIEEVKCPHPGCGKTMPFPSNVPVGYGVTCPYCKKPVLKGEEKAAGQEAEKIENDRKT